MATYYINRTIGSDISGNGSSGNPWQSIGKGLTSSILGDFLVFQDNGLQPATGPGVIAIGQFSPGAGIVSSSGLLALAGILDGSGGYHSRGMFDRSGAFNPYGIIDNTESYFASGYLDGSGNYSSSPGGTAGVTVPAPGYRLQIVRNASYMVADGTALKFPILNPPANISSVTFTIRNVATDADPPSLQITNGTISGGNAVIEASSAQTAGLTGSVNGFDKAFDLWAVLANSHVFPLIAGGVCMVVENVTGMR